MLLLGEFEHTIDAKNRLAVPAELREVLDPRRDGMSLIAAPGSNSALWLWPETTFKALSADLGGSLVGDAELVDFERAIFSQSARCPLDTAGRVRLPERLLTRYALSGSVMVLGVRDHLEVVAPGSWREAQGALPSEDEIWRRARQALAARNQSRGAGS
ncbi:MAG: hypothetical protein MK085_08920 [Phycisphaerales bacterium]|nr:hypothetical protein [Phycisphaerales bacterium]